MSSDYSEEKSVTVDAPLSIEDAWASHAGASPQDPTTPERKRKLRDALASLPADARVLDFGCGRGEFTAYLRDLGYRATGLDISPTAIEANRREYPGIDFGCTEGGRAPFLPTGHFDAIWCTEVIEHVYEVREVFAEFQRLLRPGGLLILTTPYHGRLKNLLLVSFAFEKHFDVEYQHIRFWTRKSLAQVASQHQFVARRWDTIGRLAWIAKSFFVVLERR